MKHTQARSWILGAIVFSLTGCFSKPVPPPPPPPVKVAPVDPLTIKPLSADFVPCTKSVCGGFPQRKTTLTLKKSQVKIDKEGLVTISIKKLKDVTTGKIAEKRTFEVFLGSFGALAFYGHSVGTIVTDANGDYEGNVNMENGEPFKLKGGELKGNQFILN